MEIDAGRRRNAPFEIDRVVVGRMSADGRAWNPLRDLNMQVGRRGRRVILILDVNVEEGCLQEAPEKGCDAQCCARYPHEFLSQCNTEPATRNRRFCRRTLPKPRHK